MYLAFKILVTKNLYNYFFICLWPLKKKKKEGARNGHNLLTEKKEGGGGGGGAVLEKEYIHIHYIQGQVESVTLLGFLSVYHKGHPQLEGMHIMILKSRKQDCSSQEG